MRPRLASSALLALPALLVLPPACAADDSSTSESAASTSSATTSATASESGSSSTSTSTSTSDASTTLESTTAAETEGTTADPLACNGHAELCERPLDQVTLPATHNSFSATDDGFAPLVANHHKGVAAQLEAGVRGFLLDVTLNGDETALCHSLCALGSTPHAEILATLADFLDAHPREVIVIIYQDDVEPARIDEDFADAGLLDRVWTWDGGPMPTLGAMIDADTRLVITAEDAGPPPAWYHHAWDVFWDTPYTYHDPSEFTCAVNRGDPGNPLFLINHWLSTDSDLPSEADAATANAYDALYARADGCRQETGRQPTLLAIDFWETGDLFAVVDALNGV
ncbi:MAG: hypothetical protein R3B09_18530 [Nannocystaceae bacterium]